MVTFRFVAANFSRQIRICITISKSCWKVFFVRFHSLVLESGFFVSFNSLVLDLCGLLKGLWAQWDSTHPIFGSSSTLHRVH